MKTDPKWVPKMKKVIAIASFGVLVGCQDGSNLASPTMATPTPTRESNTNMAPSADLDLDYSDYELSDRDFTALALPQVNADRLAAGLNLATTCEVVAQFKGRQLYVSEDNTLGLMVRNAKGDVGKTDLAASGDLIFVWTPVKLDTNKLSKATLAAGVCTSSSSPSPTPAPSPSPPPSPSALTCNGQSAPSSVSCGKPTAKCKDGTYSCSQNRSGTCSSHGGVACWICPGKLCQQSAPETHLFETSFSNTTMVPVGN